LCENSAAIKTSYAIFLDLDGLVAQWTRARGYGPRCRGFESLLARFQSLTHIRSVLPLGQDIPEGGERFFNIHARQEKALFDRVKGRENLLPLRTFMAEPVNPSVLLDITDLETQLTTGNEKTQLQTISTLADRGDTGHQVLQGFMLGRQAAQVPVSTIDGRCYESLLAADTPQTQSFLQQHFPNGVVSLESEAGIDYRPLQQLLAAQNFLEADRTTLQKMCEIAGPAAVKRKWLYFSEVESFPTTDLRTINTLWLVHSEGKFGFSVQRQLWLSAGKNWEALWPKIKWKAGKTWTRYPSEFTWDLSAPKGHLPLSNQLRGVQTMNALLSHPAWTVEA
jgi:hypothetical protein